MSAIKTKFIGDNQVTYAKIQQASTATILGNPTGGTANVQQITLGTNLSFSGSVLNATGGGGATTPSVAANDSNGIVFSTGANLNQLGCNPTAVRTYNLDNSFTAGQVFTCYNKATSWNNYIYIEANDNTVIAIVPPQGYVVIVCQSSTPTTASNWSLQNRESKFVSYTPTFTNFGTVSSLTASAKLSYNEMIIKLYVSPGSVASAAGYITLAGPFNIDSAAVVNSTTAQQSSIVGVYASKIGPFLGGYLLVSPASSATNFLLGTTYNTGGTSSTALIPVNLQSIMGAGYDFSLNCTIPVLN